jgi:hypothetical protein
MDDETVKLSPGSRKGGLSRRLFIGCALCAGVVVAGGVAWQALRPAAPPSNPPSPPSPPPPPPPPPPRPSIAIRSASEKAILDNHPADLDVFRLDRNPRIVVLDFASLARQGAMLNRVAAMAEKIGQPHDRALDDTALDNAIRASGDTPETFYYGHDYGTEALAQFFAAAERQKLPLLQDERWLRGLVEQEGALSGAPLGLISIPAPNGRDVTPEMRAVILHHELAHGEFFTSPAYRAWSHDFFSRVMDAKSRAGFRAFLVSQNYDPAIEELVVNETQAYLMFTPGTLFFRADLVGLDVSSLADLRRRFREGMPEGWLRDQAVADR